MFTNKVSLIEASQRLTTAAPAEFLLMFKHGTLAVELYKPNLIDKQQPHARDEVYLIASGNAVFELEGQETTVTTGDFLFVPALAPH